MIIFDLDGTLADCGHRKHFVDPSKNDNYEIMNDYEGNGCGCGKESCLPQKWICKKTGEKWKPDWKLFYEACDEDTVISTTMRLFDFIGMNGQSHQLQIWSSRCDSTREKTIDWLNKYSFAFACHPFDIILKMRPIGDSTPDDELKEKWLDETYEDTKWGRRTPIKFIFDSSETCCSMFRRNGIFVFNCCQHNEEF